VGKEIRSIVCESSLDKWLRKNVELIGASQKLCLLHFWGLGEESGNREGERIGREITLMLGAIHPRGGLFPRRSARVNHFSCRENDISRRYPP